MVQKKDCNKHPQLYPGKDHMNDTTTWYEKIKNTNVNKENGKLEGKDGLKDYIQWYNVSDEVTLEEQPPTGSPKKQNLEMKIKHLWGPFYNMYNNHQFSKWCHRKFDQIRKNIRSNLEKGDILKPKEDYEEARNNVKMHKKDGDHEYLKTLNLREFDIKVEKKRVEHMSKFGFFYDDLELSKEEQRFAEHIREIVLAELQELSKYVKQAIEQDETIMEVFCTKYLELDSILRFIMKLPFVMEKNLKLPGQDGVKPMHEVILDTQFRQNLVNLLALCDKTKYDLESDRSAPWNGKFGASDEGKYPTEN